MSGTCITGGIYPVCLGTYCTEHTLKVFFPNYSKKESAEKYRRHGQNGKKMCFFNIIVHAAARGGTCALTLKIVSTLIKNSSRDDRPSISESTHGQPAPCRARPVNVDDGLEDVRWIRGLGSEKLRAASYALLSNLKKGLLFATGEGSTFFCRLFSTQQRPNVFASDAWPAPATHHPVVL